MQYDPIKRSLGEVFNRRPGYRKLFYLLLDLLLLRAWHIKRELRRWKRSGKRNTLSILDAGSGFGQYSYSMGRMFRKAEILGLDVKVEQINDCNVFFKDIGMADRINFQYADLVKYKKEESFDLILSVDVMEHILEDRTVFKNFYASLKEEGMLLISTPSDQGGSDVHSDEDESFVEEHVRDGYGKDEIEEKLKDAGFSRVDVKYSYGWPGKISWKLSMKYPILMLNKSKLFFLLLPVYYILAYPISFVLNFFDVRLKHSRGTGLIVNAYK